MDIFSIYDSKVDAYLQPFFSQNSAAAERELSSAVNNPGTADRPNNFNLFAEDYTLFLIGSFDANTGVISAYAPKAVINCLKLKKVSNGGANNV